jgi:hypothetical protein
MAITVVLAAGFGNQLFQYASARALSLVRGVPLVVDLRNYVEVPSASPRWPWIVDLPIAAEIRSFQDGWAPRGFSNRLKRRIADRRRYRETGHGHDPRLLDQPDGTVLFGFFQSPRHFAHVSDGVADELDMSVRPGVAGNPAIGQFDLENSVGIHVRRGDYVSLPGFQLENAGAYYGAAMGEVRDRGERAVIFSDDIAWCREQECFAGATFYPPSEGPPYIDMYAMSRCARLVIANSTFSWWAGWFAQRRGAEVTAPRTWILGRTSEEFGIVPPTWRVL